MRSLVWPLLAALFAVLATASMLLSMEREDVAPTASLGARVLHEVHTQRHHATSSHDELRTHAHVAHGHHAASLDDGDDDVDDDGDDYDVSSGDDDVEHSIGVTAAALSPEAHAAPEPADQAALGPARAHTSIPEHPPRVTAS